MKKFLFIITGLALNFLSLAQIHVKDVTKEFKAYYENGKIKITGSHYSTTNIPDGIYTYYDENGKVTSQLEYKVSVKRFSNGRISEIGSLIHLDNGWAKIGTWIYNKGRLVKMVKVNPFTPLR